jgi:predicted nucleic acid-binding protein
MKYIIFDSGPLINFAMNGLLPLFKKLRKEFSGKFIITEEVKKEIIDRPQTIKKFHLGALQLKALFDEKIIELPNLTSQQKVQLEKKKTELLNTTNNTFRTKNKNLHLIDKGEATTLALSLILKPNVIVIDERTARMLCESPENLRKLLQKKLHTSVRADEKNYPYFKNIKIIRSTELVFIAYKKNLHELKDPKILEAMLQGVKFKGCSVSEKEIQVMKKL